MTDRGTYIEHDGRPAVRFQRAYTHPAERVWHAITVPEQLTAWFPSRVRMDPRVGGRVEFTGDPYTPDFAGTVLAYDPPRRLSYAWGEDELHFTIEPTDGGCTLTLIDVLDARNAAARNAAGWHECLGGLDALIDETPSAGPHTDTAGWGPLYRSYVSAGLPSGAEVPDPI